MKEPMELTIYIPTPGGPGGPAWHPASEKPETDCLCIVVTKTGAKYFETPTGGKFMERVEWWMPLPKIPGEDGKAISE